MPPKRRQAPPRAPSRPCPGPPLPEGAPRAHERRSRTARPRSRPPRPQQRTRLSWISTEDFRICSDNSVIQRRAARTVRRIVVRWTTLAKFFRLSPRDHRHYLLRQLVLANTWLHFASQTVRQMMKTLRSLRPLRN